MNYRHAYHAGNFADVLKHLVLTLVIEHLKLKPSPFRVVDTHAGTGRYDLRSVEAEKTGEWRTGIGRLLGAPRPADIEEIVAPYVALLGADRDASGALAHYPGSPLVARRLMRAGDRLVVNELHPDDGELLADLFHHDAQTKVMGLDGYTALKALLPPKERRGAVLIDPPFEETGEFTRMARALVEAQRRFATGTLILWYPVKERAAVDRFHDLIVANCPAKTLVTELRVSADPPGGKGLVATGLAVVNPPYTLAPRLEVLVPFLARLMAVGAGAAADVRWLVGERESKDQGGADTG